MRFENEKGTNPEELIAAAHAACFSMALSLFMANEGLTPESIDTACTVDFENVDGAWTVTSSHLQTKVKSANADPAKFVLSRFRPSERDTAREMIERGWWAVESLIDIGLEKTQERYNASPPPATD